MINVTDRFAKEKVKVIRDKLKAEGIVIPYNELKYSIRNCLAGPCCDEDFIFEKRWDKLTEKFETTPSVIQKSIELNDGLYQRLHEAYDDLKQVKTIAEEEIASGKTNIVGYIAEVEYFFGYGHGDKGIPTANPSQLYALSAGTNLFWPYMAESDEDPPMPEYDEWAVENILLNDKDRKESWNFEEMDLPGLENHYIYHYMHVIFSDSAMFYPFDIEYLRPEDLTWQVHVYYFNKNLNKQLPGNSSQNT